jgi:diguanylate cyclase
VPLSNRAPSARPLAPRVAHGFLAVGFLLTAVHSFRLLGDASELSLTVLPLAALAALVVGIVRNGPRPAGPWWLLGACGVMFMVGAVVRELAGSTGDLTPQRTLLPDLFTFPGYVVFAVALVWLLKVRREQQREPGVAADAAILGLASFVVAWSMLIDPSLGGTEISTVALIGVSMYPPMTIFLVSIAARLAFTRGWHCPSHQLLLMAMGSLLVGDVIYFLTDVHVIGPPARLVDLPYGLTYSFVGAAALHPSVGAVAHPRPTSGADATRRSRIPLVAGALLMPAIVVAVWSPSNPFERALVGTAVLALVGIGIARIVVAMREQERSEELLTHQATHDSLTGLPNRLYVLDHLTRALVSHGTEGHVAVVFLDIDRFRLINDSLGHAVGDRLLCAAAERLRSLTRLNGVVSRVSGDEFVVVVTSTSPAAAATVGERLRGAFDEPLDIGPTVHVTVSVGVAHPLASGALPDAAGLIRDADTAMYRSKDRGGNAVTVFDESMRESIARRLALESNLRRSLGAGGLEVHYQPIVSLATGGIEGFEALARWRTDDGWVPPSEFIPVAEESGLIIPLASWMLDRACRQMARWRRTETGRCMTMSVNVSPYQLRSTDLVEVVRRALQSSGLPGEALWLELTESAIMLDTVETANTLEALHELGVRVCLDDFGTGFSSLSYLQTFAIDRLKIDRSFVDGVETAEASRSLVSAILAIAEALRIDVVAEGIETSAQESILRTLGCRGGQGYLYGRPSAGWEVTARYWPERDQADAGLPSAAGVV